MLVRDLGFTAKSVTELLLLDSDAISFRTKARMLSQILVFSAKSVTELFLLNSDAVSV